jgi:hypothetical protein
MQILPIIFPVRLRNYDLADLPFYKDLWTDFRSDFRDWRQVAPVVTLCFVAIITQVIGLATRNSPALATSCFFTCLLGCIRWGWILSYYRISWVLDSNLMLFIITGCMSLSIWAIFILEHIGILDSLGALLVRCASSISYVGLQLTFLGIRFCTQSIGVPISCLFWLL